MGSGKTTIARIIARQLHMEALDLDALIEQKCGLSISKIFEQHGEIFFRKMEREMLEQIIATRNNFVMALGGGTPCYANNHLLLDNADILSVYLRASIDTLEQRLSDNTTRPLLNHIPAGERHDYIAKHLFDRSYFYNSAKLKVGTDNKSPDQVAAEIIAALA